MGDGNASRHVVIVGAGFTGLAAAYQLAQRGITATLVEQDDEIGGLAGSFRVNGRRLEKFYHHWFNNDRHILNLIRELGADNHILTRPTRTGTWYANSIRKLCTPLDVLQYKPLSLRGRIQLGLTVLRARRVKDWRRLEQQSAREWLLGLCGEEVCRVVWDPLLEGKFGAAASDVSAVWMWNKLVLRGGSRDRRGRENLMYFRGGFAALADLMADEIRRAGGQVLTRTRAESLMIEGGQARGVLAGGREIRGDAVILTPALPIVADLAERHVGAAYLESLRRIDYLANVCLVLELDRSLSDIYWLNVSDPDFPYVGIIEHTNFEPADRYHGRHIVYLSEYLTADHEMYGMDAEALFDFSLPHIRRVFPGFERSWVLNHHVWKARYAQPIVVRNYSRLIPEMRMPQARCYLATMAQVYPEDRGTNYAVRDGRQVADQVADDLAGTDTQYAAGAGQI